MHNSSSFSDSTSESEDETSNLNFDGGSKEGRERTDVAAVDGGEVGGENREALENEEDRDESGLDAAESGGDVELDAGLIDGLRRRPDGLLTRSAAAAEGGVKEEGRLAGEIVRKCVAPASLRSDEASS